VSIEDINENIDMKAKNITNEDKENVKECLINTYGFKVEKIFIEE